MSLLNTHSINHNKRAQHLPHPRYVNCCAHVHLRAVLTEDTQCCALLDIIGPDGGVLQHSIAGMTKNVHMGCAMGCAMNVHIDVKLWNVKQKHNIETVTCCRRGYTFCMGMCECGEVHSAGISHARMHACSTDL